MTGRITSYIKVYYIPINYTGSIVYKPATGSITTTTTTMCLQFQALKTVICLLYFYPMRTTSVTLQQEERFLRIFSISVHLNKPIVFPVLTHFILDNDFFNFLHLLHFLTCTIHLFRTSC